MLNHFYLFEVILNQFKEWILLNAYYVLRIFQLLPYELLDCKEIQSFHPRGDQSWGVYQKDWCWSSNSNTLATWWEEMTHLKRPRCWERLRAGGEGDERGWDGWMALPIQWTWVWVNSGSWWWTGRPGVLWFMGLQRVRHDWATELNWTIWTWQNLIYVLEKQKW